MRRWLVLASVFLLSGCAGGHLYSAYFYVDRVSNQYDCVINGVQVTKLFNHVEEAFKVCDDLNKALGPYADIPDPKHVDDSSGIPAAAF